MHTNRNAISHTKILGKKKKKREVLLDTKLKIIIKLMYTMNLNILHE